MKIKTFELERLQSLYENTVDYNLATSLSVLAKI